MPTSREILKGKAEYSSAAITTGNEGVDDSSNHSFQKFLSLLIAAQPMSLEVIYAPLNFHAICPHPIFLDIQKNKDKFLNSNVDKFVGYAIKQAVNYGKRGNRIETIKIFMELFSKTPHKMLSEIDQDVLNALIEANDHCGFVDIENQHGMMKHIEIVGRKFPETIACKVAYNTLDAAFKQYGKRANQAYGIGIDYKAMMHAVRISEEGIEYLNTGNITLPRPNSDFLKSIRLGEVPKEKIEETIDQRLFELEEAKKNTKLPNSPDLEFIENMLLDVHKNRVLDLY